MAHNFIADKATLDAVKVDTTDIRTVVNAIPTGDMHGKAVFTADGTFTVPSWVTEITVSACAAGDNGTGGTDGIASYTIYGAGGNGGASGEYVYANKYSVAPSSSIDITVGIGNTVIGTLLTLIKGAGPVGSGRECGNGGNGGTGGTGGTGGSTPFGTGGAGGGGAGYSGSYMPGGNGGGGSGYGAGGGGGGGGTPYGPGGNGGAGAPGIVIIEW